MSGHTPGPWTACLLEAKGHEDFARYVEQTIRVGTPDFFFLVLAQKPEGPADVCHTGNGPNSADNARLIAAAPELLAAANALHVFIMRSGIVPLAEALGAGEEMERLAGMTLAALAKARGEAP